MDSTVLIVALLALVAVGFFAVFRGKASLEMEGDNEPTGPNPGVRGKGLKAGEDIRAASYSQVADAGRANRHGPAGGGTPTGSALRR